MKTPTMTLAERVHALATPVRGVLGLVDEMLALGTEHGLQFQWQDGRCIVRLMDEGAAGLMTVPLRKSVVRAALARIAVLCNERRADSVSPYGGQGELMVEATSGAVLRVVFANTPDEQWLELASVRSNGVVGGTAQ
jgi:hypothetical protein